MALSHTSPVNTMMALSQYRVMAESHHIASLRGAMTQQRAPFGLRMPEVLKEKVRENAERNARSVNREIVYRLEQAYQAEAAPQNE